VGRDQEKGAIGQRDTGVSLGSCDEPAKHQTCLVERSLGVCVGHFDPGAWFHLVSLGFAWFTWFRSGEGKQIEFWMYRTLYEIISQMMCGHFLTRRNVAIALVPLAPRIGFLGNPG
jgi:hypothetical protein